MDSEKIVSCNHKTLDTTRMSEIYEEIMDSACSSKSGTFPLNVYENIDKNLYDLPMEPPPLPPRQNQKQGYIDEDRYDYKFEFSLGSF